MRGATARMRFLINAQPDSMGSPANSLMARRKLFILKFQATSLHVNKKP